MFDSIQTLSTIEDCDLVLTAANNDLAEVNYRRTQLSKKNALALTEGPNVERDVVTVSSKVAAMEAGILTMPEGEAKKEYEIELAKLRIKLFGLLARQGNYGLISLLQMQFEFVALGGYVIELDNFITAVEAKKATL